MPFPSQIAQYEKVIHLDLDLVWGKSGLMSRSIMTTQSMCYKIAFTHASSMALGMAMSISQPAHSVTLEWNSFTDIEKIVFHGAQRMNPIAFHTCPARYRQS